MTSSLSLPAVFMRGGTSKGLFFRDSDLPEDPAVRTRIFLAALGSPDPYGRQLDGLGGGVSSLSKIMVVAPSRAPDIDVQYTFGQVAVDRAVVDYSSNCGNLSSAVGPFAVDDGLVRGSGDLAVLRLLNTNTGKIVRSEFGLVGGRARVDGNLAIPGVAGRGAPVRLDFLDPGGAVTGSLLPTGAVRDRLTVKGWGTYEVSIIDAATPVVTVRAREVGLKATEPPDVLQEDSRLLHKLEAIRVAAGAAAGLGTEEKVRRDLPATPKLLLVAEPADGPSLDGSELSATDMDLVVRAISMGLPHRAVPLTTAVCLTVAANIEGTLPHEVARNRASSDLRIGHPSGILTLSAEVDRQTEWKARSVSVFRTARRLMAGEVYVPSPPENTWTRTM